MDIHHKKCNWLVIPDFLSSIRIKCHCDIQSLWSLLPVVLHFIPFSLFRSLPNRRLVACPASLPDKQFKLQP